MEKFKLKKIIVYKGELKPNQKDDSGNCGRTLMSREMVRKIQIDSLHSLNLPKEGQVPTTLPCAGLPWEAASANHLEVSLLQESAVLSRRWSVRSLPADIFILLIPVFSFSIYPSVLPHLFTQNRKIKRKQTKGIVG